jgi:hypothetical protein
LNGCGEDGVNHFVNRKIILCLALVAFDLSSHARAVRLWSEAELRDASDLVVVGSPIVTKDLDETNSLGWTGTESFRPKFRGVETTFKVSDVLKGMPANDQIVLHHYRFETGWGSPPNGPDFVSFPANRTNTFLLYLINDGTNRYAPAAGQIDPGLSVRSPPKKSFGFPLLPPIADANPAIRCPVQVHIPVRLHAERKERSIKIEASEMVVTNLTVGTNMITGTECETKAYQGGRLLSVGGSSLQGGFGDGGYREDLRLDFEKSLKPDENISVEIKMTLFETDESAQHMWSPQSGKKYQALWEQTFKLIVK